MPDGLTRYQSVVVSVASFCRFVFSHCLVCLSKCLKQTKNSVQGLVDLNRQFSEKVAVREVKQRFVNKYNFAKKVGLVY